MANGSAIVLRRTLRALRARAELTAAQLTEAEAALQDAAALVDELSARLGRLQDALDALEKLQG